MKVLEVIRRLFLLPWALWRPNRLPRCRQCGKRLGALDEDHWRYCRTEAPHD